MNSLEFARGIARIMDRNDKYGLRRYVEERSDGLTRITDPSRPFRVLAHLVVDHVAPEEVCKFLPQERVTVREAARILMDLADRTRMSHGDKTVLTDSAMHQLVRRSIFIYFLHLMAQDSYDRMEMPTEVVTPEPGEDIEVRFSHRDVYVSHAAQVRWSVLVSDPERFHIIAQFLAAFRPEDYREGYYRLMATVVDMSPSPDAETLRKLLTQVRKPGVVN